MPWKPKDASRHTKKAYTPSKQKAWSKVANHALESGKSEGEAIRIANHVLKNATK